MISKIKDDSIQAICRMFRGLLFQLPEAVVLLYCIDTVSIYETLDRQDETRFAFRTVTPLLGAEKMKGTFKLLITSSARSLDIDDCINEEKILRVPDYVDDN